MRSRTLLTATGLCALLLATSAKRQDEKLVLEKGDHTLPELIRKTGDFLGHTYLLDAKQNPAINNPDSPMNKVTLPRKLDLTKADCEAVMTRILGAEGWVRVQLNEKHKVWDWIWMQGPKSQDIKKSVQYVAVEDINKPGPYDFVATVVALKHINAQLASANLRTFWNDPRGLTNIVPLGGGSRRSLMVSGFRPEVRTMVAVLQKVDVESTLPPPLDERLRNIERRLKTVEKAVGGKKD